MPFFDLIRQSIYSPEFYSVLPAKPFSFSLKYFFSLALLFVIVLTVTVSWSAVPAVYSLVQGVGADLLEHFPPDLVVTVRGGSASVNAPEPYAVPLPEELRDSSAPQPQNLLVIDTREGPVLERYEGYDTLVFLTKTNLVYREKSGRATAQSLAELPDTTIDRALVDRTVGWLRAFSRWVIPPLLIALLFLVFAMLYLATFVYLFFGALLVWLVAKIKKAPRSYWQAYQAGLHAVTLGLIVETFIGATLPGKAPPFLFTFLLAAVAWFNLTLTTPQALTPPREGDAIP